ncbi:MAG TPA: hypothetical protein VKW77_01600, partial [Acidimicrobiales bacterium]|nr:hypothetical protein [Acidimicrobiales bacterium]
HRRERAGAAGAAGSGLSVACAYDVPPAWEEPAPSRWLPIRRSGAPSRRAAARRACSTTVPSGASSTTAPQRRHAHRRAGG